MILNRTFSFFLVAASALPFAARAEDWPQWRGPRSDGSSLEQALPTAWSRDRGVCWATDLPGEGHSSPIVSGGSVFVTAALGDGRERALVRLDAATGRIAWTKTVATSRDLEPLHGENNAASSTPATDGRAVYTSFYESGRTHLAAVPAALGVHEYAPRAVKLAVVGVGGAEKAQVAHMVKQLLRVDLRLAADAADALAIAICHANSRKIEPLIEGARA